jgi:pyrimidine operon attenuation protein/uracil phosphoribosyltransferase
MSRHTVIFDHATMARKLRRIAHQLLEEHHREESLVLVGVAPRGALLAQRLAERLLAIAPELHIDLAELRLDKDHPHAAPVNISIDREALHDRVVVLVDDVLMSGRTLMHAAAYLVQVPLKKLTTVVLVDRRHRTFPIRADIVGLTLSTTVQDHITVEFGAEDTVYLA